MGYPEDEAVKIVADGDLQFCLVRNSCGHYCGYVRFPRRPVKEEGYNGIIIYVPVHGGVSYAEQDSGGMVYGFDCNHFGDLGNPLLEDEEWLLAECKRMATGILAAARYEDEYLEAEDKISVLQKMHAELQERGIEFDLADNFGVIINALTGRL